MRVDVDATTGNGYVSNATNSYTGTQYAFYVENTFANGGCGMTPTYMKGTGIAVIGNDFHRPTCAGGRHTFRVAGAKKIIINDNDFTATSTFDDFTIRAAARNGLPSSDWSLVQGNRFGWHVQISPQNTRSDEAIQYGVFENNHCVFIPDQAGLRACVGQMLAKDWVFRNNIGHNAAYLFALQSENEVGTKSSNLEFYNNVLYSRDARWESADATVMTMGIAANAAGMVFRNNIMDHNSSSARISGCAPGSSCVYDTNHYYTPGNTAVCEHPDGNTGPTYCTSPNWTSMVESNADYMLPQWSGDINSGSTSVSVPYDYKFTLSPINQIDVGAREQ